ncbi:1667_t:CDS:1, partial [Acaulospora morrowiae]
PTRQGRNKTKKKPNKSSRVVLMRERKPQSDDMKSTSYFIPKYRLQKPPIEDTSQSEGLPLPSESEKKLIEKKSEKENQKANTLKNEPMVKDKKKIGNRKLSIRS